MVLIPIPNHLWGGRSPLGLEPSSRDSHALLAAHRTQKAGSICTDRKRKAQGHFPSPAAAPSLLLSQNTQHPSLWVQGGVCRIPSSSPHSLQQDGWLCYPAWKLRTAPPDCTLPAEEPGHPDTAPPTSPSPHGCIPRTRGLLPAPGGNG